MEAKSTQRTFNAPRSYARRSSKDGTYQTISQIHATPTVSPTQQIPFSAHIPTSEAQDALLRTGNTTPGMDGITTKMLQAIWPSISHVITLLYSACLTLGYHPTAFKTAEVAMIPKLNKRDLSDISAWRPISLLSCLSKGLERAVGRRLAYLAIKYKVLHPNQAGALPKSLD
jgi:hypothetical protein